MCRVIVVMGIVHLLLHVGKRAGNKTLIHDRIVDRHKPGHDGEEKILRLIIVHVHDIRAHAGAESIKQIADGVRVP